MPVPGPRMQDRPLPGYNNPDNEQTHRFNQWDRPGPVAIAGRTPTTMFVTLRGNLLAPGQVRRFWRQVADMIPAQAAYSWTQSAPAPGRPIIGQRGFKITTALRYMTRSVYVAGGTDASRYTGLHTKVHPHVKSKPVTMNSGNVRNRPVIRNRITSFGSRVPPMNAKVPAAHE